MRWINELKTLLLSPKQEGLWSSDFEGEFDGRDFLYAAQLIVLSFLFSGLHLLIYRFIHTPSSQNSPDWKPLAQFIGTPIQFIIIFALLAVFLWIGSYFNKTPIKLQPCFKASLRVMSIFPAMQILHLSKIGAILILMMIGFFAVKTAVNFLKMPLRKAAVFYSAVYLMFIFMQLKALLVPTATIKQ